MRIPDHHKYPVISFVLVNVFMCLIMLCGCDQKDRNSIIRTYDNGKAWYRYNTRTKVSETFYPDGKLRCKAVQSSKEDPDAIPFIAIQKVTNKVSIAYYKKETCYDENGSVIKNGMLKGYLLNGILNSEIPYQNGKANGVGRFAGGNEEIYKDGILIGTRDFKNGKLSVETIFHVGEAPIIKKYDETGTIKPDA